MRSIISSGFEGTDNDDADAKIDGGKRRINADLVQLFSGNLYSIILNEIDKENRSSIQQSKQQRDGNNISVEHVKSLSPFARLLLDTIQTGIIVVNSQLEISVANRHAAEKVFGSKNVDNQSLPDLIGLRGRDRQLFIEKIAKVFTLQRPQLDRNIVLYDRFVIDNRVFRFTGEIIWQDEFPLELVYTVEDITLHEGALHNMRMARIGQNIQKNQVEFDKSIREINQLLLETFDLSLINNQSQIGVNLKSMIQRFIEWGLMDLGKLFSLAKRMDRLDPIMVVVLLKAYHIYFQTNQRHLHLDTLDFGQDQNRMLTCKQTFSQMSDGEALRIKNWLEVSHGLGISVKIGEHADFIGYLSEKFDEYIQITIE